MLGSAACRARSAPAVHARAQGRSLAPHKQGGRAAPRKGAAAPLTAARQRDSVLDSSWASCSWGRAYSGGPSPPPPPPPPRRPAQRRAEPASWSQSARPRPPVATAYSSATATGAGARQAWAASCESCRRSSIPALRGPRLPPPPPCGKRGGRAEKLYRAGRQVGESGRGPPRCPKTQARGRESGSAGRETSGGGTLPLPPRMPSCPPLPLAPALTHDHAGLHSVACSQHANASGMVCTVPLSEKAVQAGPAPACTCCLAATRTAQQEQEPPPRPAPPPPHPPHSGCLPPAGPDRAWRSACRAPEPG